MDYQEKRSIVSRMQINKESGTVPYFALDREQGVSEHSPPFYAMLLIFEREVEITVEGEPYHLTPGMVIVMPANIPPVVHALIQFKMMLW